MAPKIIAVTADSDVVTPAQEIPSFFGVSSLSMSQKGGYKPTFSLEKFLPSMKKGRKKRSGVILRRRRKSSQKNIDGIPHKQKRRKVSAKASRRSRRG